jgi:hypothetical protein
MTWIDAAEEAMQELSTDLGIPYDYQRNRSPVDQLPDSYMVYFLVDDPVESVFDGRAQTHQPRVQASFFFRDPRKMLTVPDQKNFKKWVSALVMLAQSRINPIPAITAGGGIFTVMRILERNDLIWRILR